MLLKDGLNATPSPSSWGDASLAAVGRSALALLIRGTYFISFSRYCNVRFIRKIPASDRPSRLCVCILLIINELCRELHTSVHLDSGASDPEKARKTKAFSCASGLRF